LPGDSSQSLTNVLLTVGDVRILEQARPEMLTVRDVRIL